MRERNTQIAKRLISLREQPLHLLTDFVGTMAKMKNKSSTATPNPMSAKLKSNTEARTTYVNIVAAVKQAMQT